MTFKSNVLADLRNLHLKDATHLASLLETAARLKTPRSFGKPQEYGDIAVNSRGYTQAESRKGSYVASKRRNKQALTKAFPAVYQLLNDKGEKQLAKQLVMELTKYGINGLQLHKQAMQAREAPLPLFEQTVSPPKNKVDHAARTRKADEARILRLWQKGGSELVIDATLSKEDYLEWQAQGGSRTLPAHII